MFRRAENMTLHILVEKVYYLKRKLSIVFPVLFMRTTIAPCVPQCHLAKPLNFLTFTASLMPISYPEGATLQCTIQSGK